MAGYLSHFFCVGIPAAVIFACFYPYRRRSLEAQGFHTSWLREAALHLFVLCLFGLAAMVLWPAYHFEPSEGLWGDLVLHIGRESRTSNINTVPLRMVTDYLQAFREGQVFYPVVMLFGNICTFFPLGFFPALLFRNFSRRKTFFFGLAFSCGAEFCQFFLGRHCDVDDVILNVLGVMAGYGLFRLLKQVSPGFTDRFHLKS